MKRKRHIAICIAMLIMVFLITACGSSESTGNSVSQSAATTVAAEQTTKAVEAELQEANDKVQILKDRGVYYGYNTVLGNFTAGVIDSTEYEEKLTIDSGLKFVDENNDLFPTNDPGVDYYNSVDFSVEKRTLEKYPTKEYGLMRVGGCVTDIIYSESDEEIRDLIERNGYTMLAISGYAQSSNQVETYTVLFYGDLPNVFKGSSIFVIGTPIALYTDQGYDGVEMVASMIHFSDTDLTNTIVYGKTQAESSIEMAYGFWYYSLMSEDKMREESIRLKKEHLGLNADSTDEDIPVEMFEGDWNAGKIGIDYISISIYPLSSKNAEKYSQYKGKYEYCLGIFSPHETYEYFGNLKGNKLEFETELGTVVFSLSFNIADPPVLTLAEEWFSDGSGSKNGIYLHCSLSQGQLESLRGSAPDSDIADVKTTIESIAGTYEDSNGYKLVVKNVSEGCDEFYVDMERMSEDGKYILNDCYFAKQADGTYHFQEESSYGYIIKFDENSIQFTEWELGEGDTTTVYQKISNDTTPLPNMGVQ